MDERIEESREATEDNACIDDVEIDESPDAARGPGFWSRTLTLAGLIVLGVAPWAQAQLPPPNQPAFCPPLTSLATPTLFNVLTGTTPFRFPFQ